MSKKAENRTIGFVLKTKKAEASFRSYCPEKIIRFFGLKKENFEGAELESLKQGKDYEIMWS